MSRARQPARIRFEDIDATAAARAATKLMEAQTDAAFRAAETTETRARWNDFETHQKEKSK